MMAEGDLDFVTLTLLEAIEDYEKCERDVKETTEECNKLEQFTLAAFAKSEKNNLQRRKKEDDWMELIPLMKAEIERAARETSEMKHKWEQLQRAAEVEQAEIDAKRAELASSKERLKRLEAERRAKEIVYRQQNRR